MHSLPTPETYRKNVAAVVLNEDGEILVCKRADEHKAWQLPQGGIDPGETAEQALMRELEEEIGTNKVRIIGRLKEPLRYEWPENLYERGHRGQEQVYFLVRIEPGCNIPLETQATEEFDTMKWTTSAEFLASINGFKADAYKLALDMLSKKFPGLIL